MMARENLFLHPRLDFFYGGMIPSGDSPRDYRLPHLHDKTADQVRGSVDLRQYLGQSQLTPVPNQLQIGSCVGQAWAGMRGAAAAKYHIEAGETPDLGDDISARFIYDLGRAKFAKTYPRDSGLDMRNGGQVIAQYGVSPERFCPYTGRADNGPIAQDITPEAYQAALSYGAYTYYRLDGTGRDPVAVLKACLNENWCAVIAILVPQSFENTGPDGRVVMPGSSEQPLGGHALLVCGYYTDQSYAGGGAFVIRNSWGMSWGDYGYCYLPWAYFTTRSPADGYWVQESWSLR